MFNNIIMKRLLFICLAVLAFTGCENGEVETDLVKIVGGAKDQTVAADRTSGEDVRFITTGAWSTKVDASAAEDGEAWITLDPASGDAAGEYTMSIKLEVNESDEARAAIVSILCGDSSVRFTVEQQGRNGGDEPDDNPGDEPGVDGELKLVSRISFTPDIWTGMPDGYYTEGRKSYEFKYDAENRITEYSIGMYSSDGTLGQNRKCVLDYGFAGEIGITETDDSDYLDEYTVFLNDAGYVGSVTAEDYDGSQLEYSFMYSEDRLSKISWTNYGTDYYYTYTYNGGLLSSIQTSSYSGAWEEDLDVFFGTTANDTANLDFNMLFLSLGPRDSGHLNGDSYDDMPGRLDRLALLRLVGKSSDCYLAETIWDESAGVGRDDIYTEPGTFHETYESLGYDSDDKLYYEFNDDGSVASITYRETVTLTRIEYDVVVSDRLRDPEYLEAGYEYTIENRTETDLGSGENSYTYSVEYK